MKLGYADPPYIGQSKKHYGDHPDYAGEVDHYDLIKRLDGEYDGWVLHLSSPSLPEVIRCADRAEVFDYRIMSWVKPFAAFKPNVPVAYAWEPVLVKSARKPVVSGRMTMRDWLAENITMQRGLSGAKPEMVCRWLFEVVGADPHDTLDDIYPGSGAVTDAWVRWCSDVINPGSAPPPSKSRFDRLPKWAQMEMLSLRDQVQESA